MGTCQRPASRPYFFVISSAEAEGEVGFFISSVFSLIALTLKLLKMGLEGWIELKQQNLEFLLSNEEDEKKQGTTRAVAIFFFFSANRMFSVYVYINYE